MFNVVMETPEGNMRGYPIRHILDRGIDLTQFDDCDYVYDVNFDIVFVRPKSKIAVFMALLFGDLKD